jgi:hypothetical protein
MKWHAMKCPFFLVMKEHQKQKKIAENSKYSFVHLYRFHKIISYFKVLNKITTERQKV